MKGRKERWKLLKASQGVNLLCREGNSLLGHWKTEYILFCLSLAWRAGPLLSVLFILFLVNEHQLRPSKNRREQKETKEEDTPTGHRTKKGRQEKTEDYQPWKQVLEVGFCLLLSGRGRSRPINYSSSNGAPRCSKYQPWVS